MIIVHPVLNTEEHHWPCFWVKHLVAAAPAAESRKAEVLIIYRNFAPSLGNEINYVTFQCRDSIQQALAVNFKWDNVGLPQESP